MIATLIGDCFHNIRSALDHIVSAHVSETQRDKSSFPIRITDPWEKNSTGNYIRPDRVRESFDKSIHGLPGSVQTIIKDLQPYWYRTSKPQDPRAVYKDSLAIVNRLDNTDKHRRINALLEGVEDITTRVFIRGEDITDHLRESNAVMETSEMAKTDTPVAKLTSRDRTLTEAEVDVKVSGTAVVAIHIEEFKGYYRTPDTLRIAIDYVSDYVLLPILKAIEDSQL